MGTRRGSPAFTVGEFGSGERRAAATILADAFLDDPAWVGIGPRWRPHRARANRAAFWGIVTGSDRNGARIRIAHRDGEIVGLTIAFEPGAWPLPAAATGWQLPWVLAAGPLPVWRGFADERVIDRHREAPAEVPHLYLWFIGVAREHHGQGAGRALMADLNQLADSRQLPTRLETGTESNVAFYEALGYELGERFELPRSGAHLWRMERPPAATVSA